MAFTQIQKLRRMRAQNKGSNKRLAASLRVVATTLEQKGPDEFSRREIRELQGLRSMLTQRLYANACTKAVQLVMDGNYRIISGKYQVVLNHKNL